MKKLKLELETLRVESFEIAHEEKRGTVHAHHSDHSVCVGSGCASDCSCYMTCEDATCGSGCTFQTCNPLTH